MNTVDDPLSAPVGASGTRETVRVLGSRFVLAAAVPVRHSWRVGVRIFGASFGLGAARITATYTTPDGRTAQDSVYFGVQDFAPHVELIEPETQVIQQFWYGGEVETLEGIRLYSPGTSVVEVSAWDYEDGPLVCETEWEVVGPCNIQEDSPLHHTLACEAASAGVVGFDAPEFSNGAVPIELRFTAANAFGTSTASVNVFFLQDGTYLPVCGAMTCAEDADCDDSKCITGFGWCVKDPYESLGCCRCAAH